MVEDLDCWEVTGVLGLVRGTSELSETLVEGTELLRDLVEAILEEEVKFSMKDGFSFIIRWPPTRTQTTTLVSPTWTCWLPFLKVRGSLHYVFVCVCEAWLVGQAVCIQMGGSRFLKCLL